MTAYELPKSIEEPLAKAIEKYLRALLDNARYTNLQYEVNVVRNALLLTLPDILNSAVANIIDNPTERHPGPSSGFTPDRRV